MFAYENIMTDPMIEANGFMSTVTIVGIIIISGFTSYLAYIKPRIR